MARHTVLLSLSGVLWLTSVVSARAHDAPFIRSLRSQGGTTFLATNRGLMRVKEETGHLICHEAIGAHSSEALRFTMGEKGALLVATSRGLLRDESAGCGLSGMATALEGMAVQDIATEKSRPSRHWLVTAAQSKPNGLFVSSDDGQTFEPFSELALSTFFNALRISDDGKSVYRSGVVWDPESGGTTHFVDQVLTEGGTFSRTQIALGSSEREVRLLALGGSSGERVVVAVQARDDAEESRLMVSDDHGRSFVEFGRRISPKSAAFDARGTLYVAAQDGLWRADVGGDELTRVEVEHTPSCVDASGALLEVCDSIGLMEQRDGAFARLFRFDQVVGPMPCADDSVATVCQESWQDYADEIRQELSTDDADEEHSDREHSGTMNPTTPQAPKQSSGCNMRADRPSRIGVAWTALLTALTLRRRSRMTSFDF